MKEWILWTSSYFLENWQALFWGGVIVVSVVIFLMGVFKKLLANRIENDLLRKVVLAWTSVILTLPITAVMVLYNSYNWDHFWVIYAANVIGTILIYWFYENTALRNALAAVGKRIVLKFLGNPTTEDLKAVTEDVEQLLASSKPVPQSTSKYKDDDLKNL